MNGDGKPWEWFWRVLSVVAIPWAMWISVMLIDVRERVAVIEGNRFTSTQAYELMQLIDSKANRTDVPPPWFLDRVNSLEDKLENHIGSVRKDHP